MTVEKRIEEVAAELRKEQRTDPEGLVEFLQRVERELEWTNPEPRFESGTNRGNHSTKELQRALDRAAPVADGGCFTVILRPETVSALEALERSTDYRPLAGVPFAVKDLIAVAGHPIGAGSAARHDAPAEPADAEIVRSLRGLGGVPVGLTALHEFAFGVTGVNTYTGTPPNPADPARVPGGSSSGSAAAVATGVVPFALGTDTGGSVRIPAAFCGVVGFKPTYGLYPTAGVFPLSPSLDHVGVVARDLATVTRIHRALGFPVGREVPLRCIGIARDDMRAADSDVTGRIGELLDDLRRRGVEVRDVGWPGGEEIFAVSTAIMFSEAAAVHKRGLTARPEQYGEDVRERLARGLAIPAATYVTGLRRRHDIRRRVERILQQVDCVVGPTVGRVAPTIAEAGAPAVAAELVRNTRVGNVTGHPVVSLPVAGRGLPVGLQATGASDDRLLALAGQLAASSST